MKVPLGDIRPVILLAYMSYSRHVAQPPCAVTASGDAGYTSSLVHCVVSGGFDSCVSCLQFAVGLRIVSSFLRLQTWDLRQEMEVIPHLRLKHRTVQCVKVRHECSLQLHCLWPRAQYMYWECRLHFGLTSWKRDVPLKHVCVAACC